MVLYLGTDEGLAVFEGREEAWRPRYVRLRDRTVTSLAVAGPLIWIGTRDGLWRSADGGATVSRLDKGLEACHVRALAAPPPASDTVLVGTEPATILVSRDGGRSWSQSEDVVRLRNERRWSLPYSPAAGCIRGFAVAGDRFYAAVEVGGVLRSDDAGATWRLLEGSIHADVHDLAGHPTRADLLYAATGGGWYRTRSGGEAWELMGDGYTRAIWTDPERPEVVLAGPARYVGAMGRVERSNDGGDSWTLSSDGLKAPMSDMIERFATAGDYVLALTSEGALFAARRGVWMWRSLSLGVAAVRAMAVSDV